MPCLCSQELDSETLLAVTVMLIYASGGDLLITIIHLLYIMTWKKNEID